MMYIMIDDVGEVGIEVRDEFGRDMIDIARNQRLFPIHSRIYKELSILE